ncbi:Uncharacterised protein [BD1-7 clade bacterium]|uniref:TehB/YeaR-like domain-containing protein n=1 Tax=BD1-7 clade bacterium TaxID=2029982 RepID=A0A5S9QYY0_9GAMM|nr:Uncharacterised protein [BD1-7 clade bacterium]CAA0098525.1 Uncharacterised protein [BD1-7 clade bacterium]CAA0124061.1 Uncharacterised protein [BD1-7 clade bacterium]
MRQLPDNVTYYDETDTFTEKTVPLGLLNSHRTKPGTWGEIVVDEGHLYYRVLEPMIELHHLSDGDHAVIEPDKLHEVKPDGPVKFRVRFYH